VIPSNPFRGTLYASVWERAWSGKSRTAGIKAKCLECVGSVRGYITNCTAGPKSAAPCPLWLYRPYQKDDDDDADE